MGELVNLRTARKRAAREHDETRAASNRLAHGQTKDARKLEKAQQDQAEHRLDLHRIEPGDGR